MQNILIILAMLAWIPSANADYKETINPNGLMKNLEGDYGVTGKGTGDDSAKLQQAIDDVAKMGGGRVSIPKGIYHVADVNLKSDVHLLIDKDAVIHPFIEGSVKKMTMFNMGVNCDRVVNTSIRGVGGPFTVQLPNPCPGLMVIRCAFVKNFLISNLRVNDSKSIYSSITFGFSGPNGKFEGCPEDGTVENASVYDAHFGYGLVQAQAAKSIHFENLSGVGGVTLRLETGAKEMNDLQIGGVWDITARNISCKDGHAAVLLGPHSTKNGVVKIEGVRAESCVVAASAGEGFVSKKQKTPNLKPGTFAAGSYIRNVHAVFGTNAQLKVKNIQNLPKELQDQVRIDADSKGISRGPSVAPVSLGENCPVVIENVSSEGFKYSPAILKKTEAGRNTH